MRSELLSKKIEWIIHSIYGSEEISLVEKWISLDSNSSRVKIHYSASEISSGSLGIHSKKKWSLTSLPNEWK